MTNSEIDVIGVYIVTGLPVPRLPARFTLINGLKQSIRSYRKWVGDRDSNISTIGFITRVFLTRIPDIGPIRLT